MNTLDEDPSPRNIIPAGHIVPGKANLNESLPTMYRNRIETLEKQQQSINQSNNFYILAPLRQSRLRRKTNENAEKLIYLRMMLEETSSVVDADISERLPIATTTVDTGKLIGAVSLGDLVVNQDIVLNNDAAAQDAFPVIQNS